MEFLIEKVKHYPCLWNMNDMSYRDIEKKDLIWERIARKCGIDNGKEAKLQWKKLRDSHREALRRRKTSMGQAAQTMRPWKYETLMEFVITQTENKDTFANDSNAPPDNHHYNYDTNTNVIESPPPSAESPVPSSSIDNKNRKRRKLITNICTKILQDREKRREERQTERDNLRRNHFDMNRDPQDALSNLFASLCQKTRELPKNLQLRVQREIFDSVARAEEEAMSITQ